MFSPGTDKNLRYARGTPEAAKAGKPLAGGWRGRFFALTGDLDYFHYILGCPNWSLSGGPCIHCQCQLNGHNTWTDYRSTAGWRATHWHPHHWRAWPNRSKCALLTLPGCSCYTIHYDWMHVKYLGCDLYTFGSCMTMLTTMIMPSTPENNLTECWSFLKAFFRQHATKSPFRYLTKLSMFVRTGKYPKLRGKASEVRHFGPALLSLWQRHMNSAITIHRQIELILKANIALEQYISDYKGEFAFPPLVAQRFEETCNTMLLLQSQVAEHFVGEGLKLFDITSKTHMLQELAIASKYISPRVVWAFMGEDQMQRVQKVAQSCTRGVGVSVQSVKLARHYRLGLHFLFQGLEQ